MSKDISISKFSSKLSPKKRRFVLSILGFFGFFVRLIDFIYPKHKKTIIFGSNSGEFISGSPKALFEYMKEKHPEYKIYFFAPFNKNFSFCKLIKYILSFFPIFLKAKFLISSHPPSDFYPFDWSKRKVLINTWHGAPLKSMFFTDKGDTKSNLKWVIKLNKKTSIFLVSSKLESALLTECFLINPKKFCFTGQPKNDVLVKKQTKILKKILGKVPEYKKVILYAPTYRRGKVSKFFPFSDFDLKHLNNFLEKNKLIILLRGHVYNRELDKKYFSDRIISFGFDVCEDIYSILPEVDILITDYSSLYIDYLLLDRPEIFIPYDLEEYKRKRGLLVDDYEFWTPGYHISTYKEFIKAIKEILSGKDVYKNKRKEINKLFNYYQTDNSCEKVFRLIDNWGK